MAASFYVGDVLIQNGSAISTAGLPSSSTSVAGIVQLNDATSSTCTNQAATANAVKIAYDLATAALPCSAFTAKGAIVSASATSTPTALAVGTNGQVLTACSTCTSGLTWTTAGGGGSLTGITSAVTTALGNNALDSITDPAVLNTAVGINAGTAITTGDQNTLVGYQAGQALTVNSANALMGHQAGVSLTGEGNVGIGNTAGPTGAATNSVFIGSGAGNISSGNSNVGIGSGSAAKATGNFNTAVGASAGSGITTGASNLFVGRNSGRTIETGSNNTIIGGYAGAAAATSNNLVISAGSSDIKLAINETDAVSFGGLTNFGTADQILVSGGSGAAPTWVTPIWQNLGTLTTTSTTLTTLLSVAAATFRGVVINLSVSDVTGGDFHTDTLQVNHNGTTANVQVIGGAHLGTAPYTASAAVTAGNLVVSVTSASTDSTKYVGNYMTFAI